MTGGGLLFQAELKAKDEEYVKALQQQREDIGRLQWLRCQCEVLFNTTPMCVHVCSEELVNRMTEQYNELRDSYDIELTAIEDAFIKERKELLDRNRRELEDLFKRREDMEAHFFEDRLATESKYQQEVRIAPQRVSWEPCSLTSCNDLRLLWVRLRI